jgi:hypothetical protein
MKSIEQLAQRAYQAYCMHAAKIDEHGASCYTLHWSQLDPGTQQCWIAATTQVWDDAVSVL